MKAAPVLVLGTLALAGCGSTTPTPTPPPSALVSTIAPRRGSLPAIVTAYGAAAPSQSGSVTLSYPQPGEISALYVTNGAAVRAGQPLLRFVTAPTARSSYQQALDALAAARKSQASTAQLLAQQLATRDQQAQADKAVADAASALAALSADGAGQPVRTLSAPFDGVVTNVVVAAGDRTPGAAPLVTVARNGGIVVTAGIQPWQKDTVHVGNVARMTRLSGGPPITGRVVRVDAMLNATTRMIDVDIAFPAGALVPGEAMRADIETGQTTGWVVPHQAVVTSGGSAQLFQVVGSKARAIPVKDLLASDSGDVVSGPINPTLPIIVEGAYQVSDGDAVRRGQ